MFASHGSASVVPSSRINSSDTQSKIVYTDELDAIRDNPLSIEAKAARKKLRSMVLNDPASFRELHKNFSTTNPFVTNVYLFQILDKPMLEKLGFSVVDRRGSTKFENGERSNSTYEKGVSSIESRQKVGDASASIFGSVLKGYNDIAAALSLNSKEKENMETHTLNQDSETKNPSRKPRRASISILQRGRESLLAPSGSPHLSASDNKRETEDKSERRSSSLPPNVNLHDLELLRDLADANDNCGSNRRRCNSTTSESNPYLKDTEPSLGFTTLSRHISMEYGNSSHNHESFLGQTVLSRHASLEYAKSSPQPEFPLGITGLNRHRSLEYTMSSKSSESPLGLTELGRNRSMEYKKQAKQSDSLLEATKLGRHRSMEYARSSKDSEFPLGVTALGRHRSMEYARPSKESESPLGVTSLGRHRSMDYPRSSEDMESPVGVTVARRRKSIENPRSCLLAGLPKDQSLEYVLSESTSAVPLARQRSTHFDYESSEEQGNSTSENSNLIIGFSDKRVRSGANERENSMNNPNDRKNKCRSQSPQNATVNTQTAALPRRASDENLASRRSSITKDAARPSGVEEFSKSRSKEKQLPGTSANRQKLETTHAPSRVRRERRHSFDEKTMQSAFLASRNIRQARDRLTGSSDKKAIKEKLDGGKCVAKNTQMPCKRGSPTIDVERNELAQSTSASLMPKQSMATVTKDEHHGLKKERISPCPSSKPEKSLPKEKRSSQDGKSIATTAKHEHNGLKKDSMSPGPSSMTEKPLSKEKRSSKDGKPRRQRRYSTSDASLLIPSAKELNGRQCLTKDARSSTRNNLSASKDRPSTAKEGRSRTREKQNCTRQRSTTKDGRVRSSRKERRSPTREGRSSTRDLRSRSVEESSKDQATSEKKENVSREARPRRERRPSLMAAKVNARRERRPSIGCDDLRGAAGLILGQFADLEV